MKVSIKRATSVVVVVLAMSLIVACTDNQSDRQLQSNVDVIQIKVFKQQSCECCGKWVDHLEEADFAAEIKNRVNLNAIKQRFNIEPRYQSCHTGVVDNYVFEGHIPASIIRQFLLEKPADAHGLAVPGMPVGSPGMEMGDRFDSYDVLLLKNDGTSEVYAHIDSPT